MVISYTTVSFPACIGELRGDAQELGKECLCCIRAYRLNYHNRSSDRKGRVDAVVCTSSGVIWSHGVDANDGHAPLVAWCTERRVGEAGVNGAICLESKQLE